MKETQPERIDGIQEGILEKTSFGVECCLVKNSLYGVRLLCIESGYKIEPRMHLHRETMLSVISGAGTIIIDGVPRALHPSAVCTVIAGEAYEISNDGLIPLRLAEIRIGEYLEDDDKLSVPDDLNVACSEGLEDLLTRGRS